MHWCRNTNGPYFHLATLGFTEVLQMGISQFSKATCPTLVQQGTKVQLPMKFLSVSLTLLVSTENS